MSSILFEVLIAWSKIIKLFAGVGVQIPIQGLKSGRFYGDFKFQMLQRCFSGKPVTTSFLLRKIFFIDELWETDFVQFAHWRLRLWCTFYGSVRQQWTCRVWDLEACKNVVVGDSVSVLFLKPC